VTHESPPVPSREITHQDRARIAAARSINFGMRIAHKTSRGRIDGYFLASLRRAQPQLLHVKENTMELLVGMPVLYAAMQYSLLYLLLGGGLGGAILIYIVAKALGQ
jgi:hypothetical protein